MAKTKSKRSARRAYDRQAAKDNQRVPRDWRNDPAWLRDLLERTYNLLPDDISEVVEAGGGSAREVDTLLAQVRFVLRNPLADARLELERARRDLRDEVTRRAARINEVTDDARAAADGGSV